MPMLSRKTFGGGNHKWLASTHGTGNAPTGTLTVTGFTAGTHYPNGYIPSGTPVDVSDIGAVVPYVAPLDGEPALNLGFLLDDAEVVGGEASPVAIIRHGSIVAAEVPGSFVAPAFAPGFTFE